MHGAQASFFRQSERFVVHSERSLVGRGLSPVPPSCSAIPCWECGAGPTTLLERGTGEHRKLVGAAMECRAKRKPPTSISTQGTSQLAPPGPQAEPINKRPTVSHAGHCPSWARTRTLLIQSPLAQANISDNLLGFGHLPSIGARIPAVVCPLVPGETTAKLRRCRPSVVPPLCPEPDRRHHG
jgi:hypothetical protein